MPAKAHARIMHKNPNPRGACLCSPTQKASGCDGPYLVFTHSEMMDPRQPNPVLSLACAEKFFAKRLKTVPTPLPAPGAGATALDPGVKKALEALAEALDPTPEAA